MQHHSESIGSSGRSRGRPRGFDNKAALEAAMWNFWAVGYDNATVDTMCRATNMSRASLYQSFGGKEGLFLAAVAHYAETRAARVAAALGPNGSLPEDLSAFFDEVVSLATADPQTPGCLISCVLADVAGSNDRFRAELDRRFGALEDRLADRFRHAGWPDKALVTPVAAAGLAAAAARGIMLRARSGRPKADLAATGAAAVMAIVQLFA